MIREAQKWDKGTFFCLDAFEYRPGSRTAWLRFQNHDSYEVPASILWKNRSGKPDWRRAHIDSETGDVLLVPTVAGFPAIEGSVAEIPGDVIRSLTDSEYGKYVDGLSADWARRVELDRAGRRRQVLKRGKSISSLVGSYVVWLEPPIVRGKGHFCHFSWRCTSFRIRDYLKHDMYHQEGARLRNSGFWENVTPTRLPRDEVWRRASVRIRCSGALDHRVDDFKWWYKELKAMTAEQQKPVG